MRTVAKPAPADLPYDEATVLAALSPDDRRAFMALDPAERKFLLTATDEERALYAQLPPREQTRFARLSPPHRKNFLELSPEERKGTAALDDAALLRFLSVDRTGRSAFESAAPKLPSAQPVSARAASAQGASSRIARELRESMGVLGFDPATAPALGPACALAHNLLASGRDEATARTAALRHFLLSPEVLPSVLRGLSPKISPELLRRALPLLPEVVATSIQGDMDHDSVLAALEKGIRARLTRKVRAARVPGVLGERISLIGLAMVGGIPA